MSQSEIHVRQATAEDAAAIARLLHDFNLEYSEPTPGVETLTEHVGRLQEESEIVVFLAGDGPDGLSLFRFRPSLWTGEPETHLEELYVIPSLRGHGIGRRLLEATIEFARAAGATGIDLNTGESDTAARNLYESMGFTNKEGGPDGPSMLFYEREI
ncbi:MAG TPA: GNAT family N-acetyltransferase [Solirubrobacterales bacterium]|jgi:ribosomal protein S18 acetylase RimI-like enzyme|nr:GNAT family N-acetyltransferase [Solirubrobacterales bacterium]